MAFDRILKSATNAARMMALAPLVLAPLALTTAAPAQAQSVGVGVQTCTVVLFVEVCTGGGASVGSGSASPAPAPMMGGSILSLVALGGFVALRRRMAARAQDNDQPSIED
jgi:hypothetical protein